MKSEMLRRLEASVTGKVAALEDMLVADKPSAKEKAVLDEALEEYRCHPNAGRPWREAMDDLERKAKP